MAPYILHPPSFSIKTFYQILEHNKTRSSTKNVRVSIKLVPTIGFEPTTYALRVRCSTS